MTPDRLLAAPALVALAAAVVCAGLILLLRPLLQRYALARPNARSSHRVPTPQGGGIAVIASTIIVTAATAGALPAATPLAQLWTVLPAPGFIAAVGGIDDLHPLPVTPRLLLQTIAAAAVIAMLSSDLRIFPFAPWGAERI